LIIISLLLLKQTFTLYLIKRKRFMAKVLGGIESANRSSSHSYSLHAVQTLRIALGSVILLGAIISTLGVSWDIQWHSFVGRDRTLIPPHIMMLSGVTLGGLVALIAVLIESAWARNNPQVAKHGTDFAGPFHSSIGAYVAGFAALDAAIAFPLDSYWHALYGIDVEIWAPFHIMILGGIALIPLGAAYMLISAAHLATQAGDRWATRVAYLGAIVAFGTVMAVFTYMLADGASELGILSLGTISISVFPLLAGAMIAWLLVSIVHAIPWRWAATSVILVYIAFGALFAVFVPPATNYLLVLEHMHYRRNIAAFANLSVVTMELWFLLPIIVAPLIDLFFRLGQRKGWSVRTLMIGCALLALLACIPVGILNTDRYIGLILETGTVGIVISMLLGLAGTSIGTWLGRRMGESMQQVEEA
jgi:hypothetical protein